MGCQELREMLRGTRDGVHKHITAIYLKTVVVFEKYTARLPISTITLRRSRSPGLFEEKIEDPEISIEMCQVYNWNFFRIDAESRCGC